VIISLFLAGLFFVGVLIDTFAEITKTDIDDLKQKIEDSESKMKILNRSIIDLKIGIRSYNDDLTEQKKYLENIKKEASVDWNAIPQIPKIESSIKNLETLIDRENIRLVELEDKQKTLQDTLSRLEEEYEKNYEIYQKQNTFDPSPYTKIVGIVLSDGCIESIKHNVNSTCPDYKTLKQLDTSVELYSGMFVLTDGFYSRGESPYIDGYRWYDNDPTMRIIVDPPLDHRNRIKMITIENNFQTYFVPEIDNKLHNNTRTYHELRFVDNCRYAQVSAMNWTKLVPDTVYYLRNGCTITGFDEMKIEIRDDTPWDPLESAGYQYRLWVEQMKELCKNKC
jgi:hypothetical protein